MEDLEIIGTGTTTKFLSDINTNFKTLKEGKEDILDTNQKRMIYIGNDAPANNKGNEGDIYIQYEFE